MLRRWSYELGCRRNDRVTRLRGDRDPHRDRSDHIEVVGTDDLEVVLFWDVPARSTGKMEAALRDDLQRLSAEEFIARWNAVEGEDDY